MSHTSNVLLYSERSDNINLAPVDHLSPKQNPELSTESQRSIASATSWSSTVSQVDPKLFIPRTVENIITTVKISELFPRLQAVDMEKCIHICEHYRDWAYSGGCDHPGACDPKCCETKHGFQNRKVTYDQQNTPAIEDRQNQDHLDDLDDMEHRSESE
jgi:hypothetical protein